MVGPTSSAAIRERAKALGFDAVGFARADLPLDEDHGRLRQFLDAGMQGDMAYLAEHADARHRLDGSSILAGAKTVVCLARRYDRDDAADPPLAQRIARYARGQDYHGFLKKRLGKLAAELRRQGVEARALCDTAPVLERAWARRAGLGFVGKNGMIILPGAGSYCLLGEVVTTLELPEGDYGRPMAERCGTCAACLDACPTDAFVQPFVLDPRRCVSYWTIESRSMAPEPLWKALGEHLFGCDRCQEVCPYNQVPPLAAEGRTPFSPHDRWAEEGLEGLVRMDERDWERLSRGTPVRRATRRGLARNAVLLAAGLGDEQALDAACESPDAELAAFAQRVRDKKAEAASR
jgi:epoxyqueuosine reductase